MKRLLPIFVSVIFLAGCNDDAGNIDLCGDGFCTRELFTGSKIEPLQVSPDELFADIVAGDKIVFRRTYNSRDDKNIADDELTEILLFQVDEDIDSFYWKDEELEDAGVLFGRLCYCYPHGYAPVNSGTLKGTRISPGVWKITADLTVTNAVSTLKFEARFD